jgi:hypothetical protein
VGAVVTLDPKKTFWLAVPVDRSDGRISEIDSDGKISSMNREAVVQAAIADVTEYGGRIVLFECRPRRVIDRAHKKHHRRAPP